MGDPAAGAAGRLRGKGRSKVLVVANSQANGASLQGVLASAGYEVRIARDGPVALQSVRSATPHLILLEVDGASMDGYELCQALKEHERTRHIPVILVSEAVDDFAESRGFDLGAADFIIKPVVAHTLLARVKTHLALEGQRRNLEGMFRDAIEFAPDAFILADASGHIVQINMRAEQLFGYSRRELTGMSLGSLMPDTVLDMDMDTGDERNGVSVTDVAVRCRRKDGSEFPGDINIGPMQTNRGRLLMAVIRDVGDRERTQRDLAQSRAMLRALAANNEHLRESERKHIAREVHDELGQVLTALRMDMSLLDMQFGARVPALAEQVARMKKSVDRGIRAVRNVASNLRPAALDMGLVPAVEWLCGEFSELNAIPCILHAPDVDLPPDEARDIVVFRIVQESLTNVTRYARATRVEMAIAIDGAKLRVEVRDNGVGFDPAHVAARPEKSFGLLGMHERAIALGGWVAVSSVISHGTTVSLVIPLPEQQAEATP